MLKTTKRCFSNGTEYMWWIGENCNKCWKSWYISYNKRGELIQRKCRCSINRDIEDQAGWGEEINIKSWEVTQKSQCPYREEKRKPQKRKGCKAIHSQTETLF